MKLNKAFTLIELLVVVAIIGVLASVVLASLNSARSKGRATAIKSNLRNMIGEAELSYLINDNYSGACTAVNKMITSISGEGGIASCYSYNNPGYSDVHTRWGASAKVNGSTFEAYSADFTGVVTWDLLDQSTTMTWDQAVSACATVGGRLPSAEELRALRDAYVGTPTGFQSDYYWSSSVVPSNSAAAYDVNVSNGTIRSTGKSGSTYIRCVR